MESNRNMVVGSCRDVGGRCVNGADDMFSRPEMEGKILYYKYGNGMRCARDLLPSHQVFHRTKLFPGRRDASVPDAQRPPGHGTACNETKVLYRTVSSPLFYSPCSFPSPDLPSRLHLGVPRSHLLTPNSRQQTPCSFDTYIGTYLPVGYQCRETDAVKTMESSACLWGSWDSEYLSACQVHGSAACVQESISSTPGHATERAHFSYTAATSFNVGPGTTSLAAQTLLAV